MVGEKFVMHEHIDGPFLFTNTRAMFSDFKILWALMYTYRNQQKKMFHFQRLGHIARTMKQLRKTELACIEDQSVETLSEMMELARQAKQYILLNEQCMDKLFEMKLFLPFATAAEAALAGMYSCCDPLLYELSKVKQVAQESSQPVSKQIEHSHPKKRAKPDSPSIIGPNGSAHATSAKGSNPGRVKKARKEERESKMSSDRKPLTATNEIDDIFGGLD